MAIDLSTEIVNLRRSLLAMGAATERRVELATRALVHGDAAAAQEVKAGDSEIDAMEVELEGQCMRILALGSPVAHDLRFVLSVVRISSDFERIADLSRGIARGGALERRCLQRSGARSAGGHGRRHARDAGRRAGRAGKRGRAPPAATSAAPTSASMG